jgi:putative ABC transport system ATP-binding protein
MSAMTDSFIALRNVSRTYPSAGGGIHALQNVDLSIDRGDFLAVVGHSGSGKSTLLALLSGIDRPSSGEIHFDGKRLNELSEKAMSRWRGGAVGIVFQFFQLIPTLTAVENVMLPMDFAGIHRTGERLAKALAILERLGISDQAHKLPAAMSGGQQQRVAVARALANDPAVILADEPTGNLDSRTAQSLLGILSDLNRQGQTVVLVTHDDRARSYASRTITLVDGKVAQ